MKRIMSGEEAQEEGKKPVKPQDLARLYETIIQVRCTHPRSEESNVAFLS
jgi:hypothetical protein